VGCEKATWYCVPLSRNVNSEQPLVSVTFVVPGDSWSVVEIPGTPVTPVRSTICTTALPSSGFGEIRLSCWTGAFRPLGSATDELIFRYWAVEEELVQLTDPELSLTNEAVELTLKVTPATTTLRVTL
jgi:hypothetical protein